MSTLVVAYHDLEDAAKDARKAAALLEEYGGAIEEEICKKLKEYSGSWTSNIDVADQLMRDKLVQLRQKQVDFETLAANIEIFKNNCVTADHNVRAAIESLSGDFKNTYGIKENIVTKWFNYIGTEIGNGSALGRYLKEIGNTIEVAVTDGIENIKDWYKYEGGKYIIDDIVTVALVTLEVVGAVVAIASGVGAIVAISTVIATTVTVANGLTSIYNNSKAYDAMQNENPAWAMRYAGRDTFTEQMRETSDSKFVHNLATGLDVLETSAGLILFAKDGMDVLKSIKNFSGKCRILGNGGTDLIDDAAQITAKSADDIPGHISINNIKESTPTSWADLMPPEDAIKYNQWTDLREAGLDQQKINDIILTNKGYRSDPATYLSQEYIDSHLELFSEGVTKISVAIPTGQAGPPGGTFVMPKSAADEIIQAANGDVSKLEQLLSLESGTLGDSPVRLDIAEPHGVRMPSGNELGANDQWIPGGSTGGGIPEATINSPLPKEFISKLIFE
ncbi:hypothetical protein EDD66_101366 [Mobilisporobacter senegalensis]|uniref:Uncharacterized protein n=1 Tax=Mobilisporobacter senegalensis TaxID=1329262 RepID=A0A3N1XZP6_9FIRM|nr:hypothetical protein [Mobilisporobacter senegalensis]ROR31748.1 hypothetical protein EDD66_101366 [Mobilisporobacter senegalensis]